MSCAVGCLLLIVASQCPCVPPFFMTPKMNIVHFCVYIHSMMQLSHDQSMLHNLMVSSLRCNDSLRLTIMTCSFNDSSIYGLYRHDPRARENTLTAGRMYSKESNNDRQNPQNTQFNAYLIARMMLFDIRPKHDAS